MGYEIDKFEFPLEAQNQQKYLTQEWRVMWVVDTVDQVCYFTENKWEITIKNTHV